MSIIECVRQARWTNAPVSFFIRTVMKTTDKLHCVLQPELSWIHLRSGRVISSKVSYTGWMSLNGFGSDLALSPGVQMPAQHAVGYLFTFCQPVSDVSNRQHLLLASHETHGICRPATGEPSTLNSFSDDLIQQQFFCPKFKLYWYLKMCNAY